MRYVYEERNTNYRFTHFIGYVLYSLLGHGLESVILIFNQLFPDSTNPYSSSKLRYQKECTAKVYSTKSHLDCRMGMFDIIKEKVFFQEDDDIFIRLNSGSIAQ